MELTAKNMRLAGTLLPLLALLAWCPGCSSSRSALAGEGRGAGSGPAEPSGIPVIACGKLDRPNTTYVLRRDVTSAGTCFAVTAPHVVLNLNGHSVTYDAAPPVPVANGSFEAPLSGSWDTSHAPDAQRVAGTFVHPVQVYDGNYSLRFSLPAADQYVESLGTVTLEANTTYSVSAMFRNSGNNEPRENSANATRDPLELSVELAGTGHQGTSTGITWRGFQYTNAVFTTGARPVSAKIKVSLAKAATPGVTGYAYVDDIRILKAHSYGVHLGPGYANARFFTVTNGTILQGQGSGFDSHAINMEESAGEGWSIDHLAITTQGINSKAVSGRYFKNSDISFNTIRHNVATIKVRDHYDGAAIYLPYHTSTGSFNSTVHDNTFLSGVQTALFIEQTPGQKQNEIYNNRITLQTKYTNDFAILAAGAVIHDNIVDCGSGNNSCRGIGIGGHGTKVYNNNVTVQQLPRNQEYNGCQMAGAYGMQMEYQPHDVEVYGNVVTANAGECEAYALRANPEVGASSNNLVHDNTFVAIASGRGRGASSKFSALDAAALKFDRNTFRTNDRWIYLDGEGAVTNPRFSNNRWETTGKLVSPFHPFEVFTWDDSHFTGTFFGNSYGPGDREKFQTEVFRLQGQKTPDPLSRFTLSP
jgi:hypothetical protein